jgi:hypothetical protein
MQLVENKGFQLGTLTTISQGIRRSARKRKFKTEADLDKADEVSGIRYKLRPAIAEATEKARSATKSHRLPKNRRCCSTINTLKDNGMTTKFAIEQTAKIYKVTSRKMRSVWESSGLKEHETSGQLVRR